MNSSPPKHVFGDENMLFRVFAVLFSSKIVPGDGSMLFSVLAVNYISKRFLFSKSFTKFHNSVQFRLNFAKSPSNAMHFG